MKKNIKQTLGQLKALGLLSLTFFGCSPLESQKPMEENLLGQEVSPYLLQHANNPVHWKPWREDILQDAQQSNKLLIISIGYSSCHWCHVMEHESFEDEAVADTMNAHFVSIKIDREERPDVDEVYMRALQLMRNQGGWPLNIVALPDGRPVWGATYVPKQSWIEALHQLAKMWRSEPEKMEEYANSLTQGIQQTGIIEVKENQPSFDKEKLAKVVKVWQGDFDQKEGGVNRAPKFPLPGNYKFLLQYGWMTNDSEIMGHAHFTLEKIAHGGIYDQVGGGFARYSTDKEWKAPHFEKMLYDNAQLIGLYSEAYRAKANPLYKQVVIETIDWLNREMLDASGVFYSALDADSEGEEGKFYTYNLEELQQLIPTNEWASFAKYFDLDKGHWEHDQIILLRSGADGDSAQVAFWKKVLLAHREKRVRPGLDDKALTSWNALLISGLCEAYRTFAEEEYLSLAKNVAGWLLASQMKDDGQLFHAYKANKPYINGLIEDYALAIEAFLALYEATGNESYFKQAEQWGQIVDHQFKDGNSGYYFTRSKAETELIAQNQEVTDNVIPAANSVMAHNLFRLAKHTGNLELKAQGLKLMNQLADRFESYPEGHSNWLRLAMYNLYPFYEVAVLGQNHNEVMHELGKNYLPNGLLISGNKPSDMPLLKDRLVSGKTLIYVCQEGVCQLPVEQVNKAVELVNKK